MFTFNKQQRLLNKLDYDNVFAQARKIVQQEFIVLFRKNNLGYSRLGLALSKKKVAKAHERNRLKRLIREGFRHKKLPAIDVIFLARYSTINQPNLNINNTLNNIWERLNCCGDD